MNVRTDTQLLKLIAEAKEERDANMEEMTIGELEQRNKQILALQAELNAVLTEGAEPCPQCGEMPRGMRRAKDAATLGVYEVGCVNCAPTRDPKIVNSDGVQERTNISARGFSISEAVENWNNRQWVKDFKTD